ncbi:MAG: PQQ-binding-like beta-propeller repeat protein [Verrucomicrobia bacterium]|nr:PQQ-binding-like beta-propeller repeat protein [Verrucomicrobiota bacterium]
MNLYIACNGHVAAFDPKAGRELWRTQLSTGFFCATSREDVCILCDDGQVFAGCNGHLFALDAQTGRVLWHNELKGLGYNDVTLAMENKSIQVLAKHTHSHTSS